MSGFDFYFQPKFFEKSGRFYEWFGVKFFKKYLLLTSEDTPLGLWRNRSLFGYYYESKLKSLEKETRDLEVIHLFGLYVFSCFMVLAYLMSSFLFLIYFFSFLNICINLYPILVQRYNRARIYRILERRESLKKAIR